MASTRQQDDFAEWTFSQMMVRLPFDLSQFAPRELAIFCDQLAGKTRGTASLYFVELLTTVAGLTRRARLDTGLEYDPLRANLYLISIARSGTGKTKASSDVGAILDAWGHSTGTVQRVAFGTGPGVLRHIEQVLTAHGNCNLNADEGLHLLVQLLSHGSKESNSNFAPDQAFNSLWSGEELHRQFANQEPIVVRGCYLNVCASGTPAHYEKLRTYLAVVHAQGGLAGRMLTVFSQLQLQPLFPLAQLSPTETGIVACTYNELLGLFAAATIVVGQELSENGGLVFQLDVAATGFVTALQERSKPAVPQQWASVCATVRLDATRAATELQTLSPEAAWHSATNEELFHDNFCQLRLVELALKMAFNLHLMEQIIARIDFPHKQIIHLQLVRLIPIHCVRAGLAFVRFARRQQHFFDSMSARAVKQGKAGHAPTIVRENCDFVLYACLRQLLLLWPGTIITAEMVSDRGRQAHVNVPYSAICTALRQIGTEARPTPNADGQFPCAGLLVCGVSSSRRFRFYKFAPHMVTPALFAQHAITLEDYSSRYAMDYMQIRYAGCWTGARGRRAYDEIVKETPIWILTLGREVLIDDGDAESEDEMARDAWAAETEATARPPGRTLPLGRGGHSTKGCKLGDE